MVSLVMGLAFSSVRIRPAIIQGKMTNGNFYREIMPLRVSWTPIEEWNFGLGYSLGFEAPRSGGYFQTYNHRGWKTIVKAQFKPMKWVESLIGENTIADFAVSYTKQIGGFYSGSSLAVGRLDYNDYEELSVGFDFTL